MRSRSFGEGGDLAGLVSSTIFAWRVVADVRQVGGPSLPCAISATEPVVERIRAAARR